MLLQQRRNRAPLNSLRPLIPWLTLSAPLLLMLGAVYLACGSENEVFSFFRRHRADHQTLKALLTFYTNWFNAALYVWFAWLLFRSIRSGDAATKRFVLIYIAVQLVIALVTVRLLKMTIGRPRPGEDAFLQSFTAKPSYHSMPSGHTTEATTSLMALMGRYASRLRPGLAPLLFGLALALLGFSRMYLGWHHPSDVVCGWLLGSVGGMAVTLLAPTRPAPHTGDLA